MTARKNTPIRKPKMINQLTDSDVILKIMEMIEKNDAKNAEYMAKNDEVHKEIILALENIKTVTITDKNNTYSQSIEQAFANINTKMTVMEDQLSSIVKNMPEKAGVVLSHWNSKFEVFQKFVKSVAWIIAVLIGISVFVGLSKADNFDFNKIFPKSQKIEVQLPGNK
jgi:hypothetical protein